jgi:predicted DCC family thiol-disulfide oxidoreductase YuxK
MTTRASFFNRLLSRIATWEFQMNENLNIIFDGECNLCQSSIIFVIRHDRKARLRFASAQSKIGIELQKKYDIDALNHQTLVLIKDGIVHTKSDALIKIAENLDGFWKLLALVKVLPRPLRDWIYLKIAKNRYKLFPKKQSCAIPTEDVKSRFVE